MMRSQNTRNFTLLGLGLALLSAGCSGEFDEQYEDYDQLTEEIQNGTALSSGAGSVQVSVQGASRGCSGVIIAPNAILTAAHCVNDIGLGERDANVMIDYWDANSWWCLSNPSNLNRLCTSYQPGRVWVNPSYTSGAIDQDIAVVVLDRDFSYVRSAHKQMIIKSPTKSMIGSFYQIGYGSTTDTTFSLSDPPTRGKFSVTSMGSGKFTSSAHDQAICKGDSGSPSLEYNGGFRYVFGLATNVAGVSNTNRCGNDGANQSGVLVGGYVDEIEDMLGRSCRHWNHSSFGGIADCW